MAFPLNLPTVPRRVHLWIVIGGAAVTGFLFLGAAADWFEVHQAKRTWRNSPAKILQAGLKDYHRVRGVDRASLDFRYEYSISGKSYVGSRVSFDDLELFLKDALGVVRKYPAGSQTTVYYDPEEPGESVLELHNSAAFEMFVGGLFCSLLPLLVYAREVKNIRWARALR